MQRCGAARRGSSSVRAGGVRVRWVGAYAEQMSEKSTLSSDLSSHTFCATIMPASSTGCQLLSSSVSPERERTRSMYSSEMTRHLQRSANS